MRFIKKVIFVYEELTCPDEFEQLSKRLLAEHLEVEKHSSGVLFCEAGDVSEAFIHKEVDEGEAQREKANREGILWMTSDKRAARKLISQNKPVLGCILNGSDTYFDGLKYVCVDVAGLEMEYLERVYRRYKELPWDICETGRCLIRETTVADVDAFYDIYKDPSITRYMENLFADPDEERAYARDYIDKVYDFYGFGVWTVILKESGRVIGRAGLSMREGFEEPELGFVIGVPWQNKGLAHEVCLAIISYGENALEFERIMALVEQGNEASGKLCEKLGFLPEDEIADGGKIFIRYIRQSLGRKDGKNDC